MSFYKKLHPSAKSGNNPGVLTVKEALGKEGSRHYFQGSQLMVYLQSLRPNECDFLESIVNEMQNNAKLSDTGTTRSDKSNRPYRFYEINKNNGRKGFKVILEAGMKNFIEDYINGKFTINFTLEELHEEALNS